MNFLKNPLRSIRRRPLFAIFPLLLAIFAFASSWNGLTAPAPTNSRTTHGSGLFKMDDPFAPEVTTIISPTGDGGFETGIDMTANGWTVVNNATNGWFVGTATFSAGARSAYISNTSGATYAYNNATASVSHFYRDVTVPAGENGIVLSFKLRGDGDLFSGTFFDKMMVYTAPTSFTPTTAAPASSGTALAGATLVYAQAANFGATHTAQTVFLPASLAGTTFRLIFTFHCDTSTGAVPSSVDEISLTSAVLTPISGTRNIPGDYATMSAAIADLNFNGVGAGGVTVNVAAGSTFAEDTPCLTATGTAANPIVFQKSGMGANPVVQPTGTAGVNDFGLCVGGGDWITFDGIDVSIATGSAVEFGYLVRNAAATNGAQNNTIKNTSITLNRANTASIGILQTNDALGGGITPTSVGGGNSFNKYYNLTIQNVYSGLFLRTLVLGFDTNNEVGVTGGGTTTIGGATASDIGGGAVTTFGIQAIAQQNAKIFNTEVRNVGVSGAVLVDGIFLNQTGGTTECFGNRVHDIRSTSTTSTSGIVGIRTNTFNTAGPVNRVYNNFIWNITSGYTGAASGTRQIKGIQVQSNGTGIGAFQMVDFNSVRIDGSGSPNISSAALTIGTTSGVTINVRNNILANFTGAQAGVAKHYAWDSTSATLIGIAGSVSDHNVLYSPNTNGFVGIGNTTDRATITDWRNATANDLHSKSTDPQYVSATDLHIGAGATEVEGGGSFFNGAITWVANDIDAAVRNANFPDVGADEGGFTAATDVIAPDIFYTAVPNSTGTVSRTLTATITDQSGVPTAGAGLPVLYYRKGAAGAFTPATGVSTGGGNYDFLINYSALGGVVVTDVIQYYFVAQDNLGNVISNPFAGAAALTINPPAAGTAPTTPFTYTIVSGLTGSINVGTTEPTTSLTNAGGLFAQINGGALTGNLVINLTSDLTAETGTIVLNNPIEEPAGSNYTITIKPSGAARVISGTGPAAGALIKLNGVDRVTIDGSTSGGTDRSLTITNNANLTSTAAIWVASNGSNGAQNNTIKNCVINAGADQSTGTLFTFGIISTSSAAILTGGTASNNNTYSNNLIKKVSVGIASLGGSSAAPYTGTVISGNQVGPAAFGSDEIGTAGILIFNEDGCQIVDNEVRFVGDTNFPTLGGGSRDRVGIVIGSTGASWSLTSGGTSVLVSNANVSRNRVHDIVEPTTFSAVGIVDNANNVGTATNNLIANNMIWNVRANGTSPDQGVGIGISNGLGDKIVYNSIFMTGDIDPGTQTSATISSFGISINTALPANLVLQDNISWMDVSSNTGALLHSAINVPSGFVWGTGGSNRNDLFALAANPQAQVGTIGSSGGTYFATLAAWQGASGQDANSISADPLFTSPTDLHVGAGSPVVNAGSTIAGITNDIDNNPRPAGTAAEIGADELPDAVEPDTSILTNPPSQTNSNSATFTFGGTDSRLAPEVVVSFQCKLDAAAFAACTSPVILNSLADGSHTFQVRAVDSAGNVDSTPASFTWTVDTTAPDTTIDTNPGAQTGDNTPTFTFSGNDGAGVGGLTFECQIDGGGFSSCTSPFTTSALSDGSHTFQVRATDGVANTDATPASFTFTVDATAPDTNILTNPTDPTTSTSATFTFSGNDGAGVGGLTFECKLDAGSFGACTSPQNYLGLSVGSHTFQVRATDAVGNTDASPASFTWMINASGPTGPVSVTATAGTPGPTDYPTLKDAFDAINAGTHQGAITASIVTSTTETAPAVLNSSGAGAAAYTSLLIQPINDAVSVSGATATGRGLIELNGADNVTINGDNPNTAGTNRNLTLVNTAAAATTFTSVVRVALSTLITSGDNNTVKNCVINGSATGQNAAGITSTASAVHTTYGILVGGGASTVANTTAPSAIANVATVFGAGVTASNFAADNNAIDAAARGIAVMGSVVTNANNLSITSNVIGNASAASTTTVYSRGITVQGFDNTTIAKNTLQNIQSLVGTSIMAIGMGNESASGQNAVVDRNVINTVNARSTTTFGSYGINWAAGNGMTASNNFITGITGDMSGAAAFSTTFGLFGIRLGTGNNHKVYHNSVNMFGARTGTTANNLLGACFAIVSNTQNGIDVRNNIFVNTVTGGGTGIAYVGVYLPTSGTAAGMNLTWNNNDYQSGATVGVHGVAHVGTTYNAVPAGPATWAGLYTVANFDPSLTTPNTNFRAYTSSLSAAGTNDNLSQKVDPQFVSATDLHIAVASPMVDTGAAVGVVKDIDGQLRVPPPDIGADEPSGITPPANDIAATAILVPAPSSSVSTGTTVTPQASFTNVGSATQTNVGVRFTITGPGGFNYIDNKVIPSIAPDQTVNVTFAVSSTITTAGVYVTTALVTTPDANAANDSVTAGFTAIVPLSGTFTVGTGGDFTSLTNPGGIFDAINGAGASGNITINVTSDLTAETGTVALNQIAGGFTVLLQPSGGAARIISGSNATGLINLNGADGVTIDGLNTGGNSLLIRNTNVATGSVIRVINDGSNNTVTRSTIEAGNGSTAILVGAGVTTGNDNTTISNNIIRDRTDAVGAPFNGVGSAGLSAAISNGPFIVTNNTITNFGQGGVFIGTGSDNVTITGNDISSTATRATVQFGIVVNAMTGTNTISLNLIHGLRSTLLAGTGVNTEGMILVNALATTVSRNKIYDFPGAVGGTGRIAGIEFDGASGSTANVTIVNNFISIVPTAAINQNIFGLFDFGFGGNTFTSNHNSVYIGGTASGTNATWACVRGTAAPTTYSARNNICYNNRTGGGANHFAGGDQSANTGTFVSNFNFFAGTGVTAANFMDYGTSGTGTAVSFAAWQTGPPTRDANSIANTAASFDPATIFVNRDAGDLHLLATATPVFDLGTPLGTVTTDIDNDPRSATTPDIGADEFVAVGPVNADLGITKTDGVSTVTAGGSVTYTITASNAGPSAATGATVTDTFVAALGTPNWTCVGAGGGTCTAAGSGNINDTVNLPVGGSVTYTVSATVSPSAVGSLVNTASVDPPMGVTDPNSANDDATDTDTITLSADLAITKTDGVTTVNPGGSTTYTITASNAGLSNATGATVADTLPAAITSASWTCVGAGGGTCTAMGMGSINDTVNLPAGGSVTYTVNATISGAASGTLVNTAIVTAPGGVTDPNPGNDSATDIDMISTLPTMTISDARVTEGDSGNKNMTFTVTFNGGGAASAHYHTVDGTAQADVPPIGPEVAHGNDYVPEQNGIVSFGTEPNPEGGSQTRTFNIIIHGDTFKEPNEFFSVVLDTPIGAQITDSLGYGVIVDEDRAYVGDLDRDRKTDISVFRPSDQNWYTISSQTGNPVYLNYGLAIDKPVPGDYDGDGTLDYAVRRPGSQNTWWVQFSHDFSLHPYGWGIDSDLSVQADYDGDDKTDVAVFRDGTWYILRSSDNTQMTVYFGQAGDMPVPGDFDGDGKGDFTVFRSGTWFTLRSSNNTTVAQPWGAAGDKPVAGDFDGDGRFDYTVFRNGTWYILNSLNGNTTAEFWGQAGDLPVVGDYDGDGTSDVAVFRPSLGTWYILRSSDRTVVGVAWGLNGDVPIPAAYQP